MNTGIAVNTGTALYSAVGEVLTHYEVDVEAATLARRAAVTLPAKVQYAWRHPSLAVLYVSSSDGGPRVPSSYNHVSALAIRPDGSLRPLGEPQSLTRRAVHMCVDPTGRYVLNGHNYPASGITVHEIADDGSLGPEVPQDDHSGCGIYPHQVMVFPSGHTALVVDRGNKPDGAKPEDPGALRTFEFTAGVLVPRQVVAPGGGYGFGPRHVDFHPSHPWMYVSDERSNRLYMFRFTGDQLEEASAYTRNTLAQPGNIRPRQIAGPIHLHPNGRIVYLANRADHSVENQGARVFGGGENNIAVFALDARTGEPRLVQHADTRSVHVRTFACDPSGRLLVAASIKPHAVLEAGRVEQVAAALTVFRIQADGRLQFVRTYDVDTPDGRLQYWMGMIRP